MPAGLELYYSWQVRDSGANRRPRPRPHWEVRNVIRHDRGMYFAKTRNVIRQNAECHSSRVNYLPHFRIREQVLDFRDVWVVLPHSLHPCIRGQSFRLCPFGSSVPLQLVHLCSGHAKLLALLWVVLPHSLHGVHSDAECPDAPHLLHTRNLHPARFCRCPGSLHSVQ